MRPSQKQITPEQLAFAQVHALVRIVDDEADLREALSFVLDILKVVQNRHDTQVKMTF